MPASPLTDARWQLLATQQIERLKARYFDTLDAKRWDEFAALFTPDCEFITYRDADNTQPKRRRGPEEIVASVRRTVGPAVTRHQGHLLEIQFQVLQEAPRQAAAGDCNGTAIWEMTDYAEIPDGESLRIFRGAGRYYEQYRLLGERWLISRLELRRN
jgi:ketosteroid isomerase-like protein